MDIRKDFESAAPYLHRLWGIGNEFAQLNNEDWPHMKHKEDFRFVYTMEHPRRAILENVYGDGRDMAGYMAGHLREFNSGIPPPRDRKSTRLNSSHSTLSRMPSSA